MKKTCAQPIQPLIAIVGPTASGKSELAVELALHFNGEVISADSRQVYRGLDVGSGKITPAEISSVPHHLLDVADPREQFSVAQYQKLAQTITTDIRCRGNIPIICGGTAQYVKSIIDGTNFPHVPPNLALRKKLNNSTIVGLFNLLQKLDPRRASEIEKDNPRRLIRAIEIATALGSVPRQSVLRPSYSVLLLGLLPPSEELRTRIHERLIKRLNHGMIEEVERLHREGLSWERFDSFGLEYRFVARYLQKLISKEEMIKGVETASWQYSRRQLTWWKHDPRVHWLWNNALEEASSLVHKFLQPTS